MGTYEMKGVNFSSSMFDIRIVLYLARQFFSAVIPAQFPKLLDHLHTFLMKETVYVYDYKQHFEHNSYILAGNITCL